MRILICDDALFMRTVIRNMIKDEHEVVGEAVDGLDAVSKYQELSPEVTLMDITMPNLTGIEAVEQIRKFDPGAKIIMCSAMGQQKMVLDAISKGACNFIVKPFEKSKLMDAIRNTKSL